VTAQNPRRHAEPHGGAEVGTAARAPNLERLRGQLEAYMAEQGLRSTEQRRLIIDKFFESAQHLTIDELLGRVRHEDPKVGYATVYRTMKMLADGGIAHELNFGDNATRYELADEDAHHDHLICQKCGHIIEFEEPLIEELQERIAARYDFVIKHHKHELYGHCKDAAECEQRLAAHLREREHIR
jgi:Fur family ferric uptake transcriptional regulator